MKYWIVHWFNLANSYEESLLFLVLKEFSSEFITQPWMGQKKYLRKKNCTFISCLSNIQTKFIKINGWWYVNKLVFLWGGGRRFQKNKLSGLGEHMYWKARGWIAGQKLENGVSDVVFKSFWISSRAPFGKRGILDLDILKVLVVIQNWEAPIFF